VTAVVVTYNAKDLLRECLRSLSDQDYRNLGIVVVDNASTDGSRDMVREEFPSSIVAECEENLGFGPGADVGIRITTMPPLPPTASRSCLRVLQNIRRG
jgi:rhamnopyranosyl-N-acetylglucosaminyl-diphospho-decaprenol beta-1,3/1,4-galactofuranosyltransferase